MAASCTLPPLPDAFSAAVPPRPESVPGKPGADDWSTLASKMQALDVSRFTIEGQPGGRVVFSCLIPGGPPIAIGPAEIQPGGRVVFSCLSPLAGRHAVAQRFEAEGNDALQAARVALWRAAQPTQQPR